MSRNIQSKHACWPHASLHRKFTGSLLVLTERWQGKQSARRHGAHKAVLVQVRFCFMAKHMLGSLFMTKRMSLNAKQCLKKKSKK